MTVRKLEYWPLDRLLPADRNAKGHDGDMIAGSIERFGFIEPAIVDERTGQLIAGHGRREDLIARHAAGLSAPDGVKVARDGRWSVPVVRGWSSADDGEALAAGVALNRTVEAGGWEDEQLLGILQDLASTPAGFEGLGFTSQDLDDLSWQLSHTATPAKKSDPDDVPALPSKAVTKLGDVWELGEHRLLCGSAENVDDVARVMAGELAHLFATDPPYGVDYSEIADGRGNDKPGGWRPIGNDDLRGDDLERLLTDSFVLAVEHLADDAAWLVWHAPGENRTLTRKALDAAGVLVHKEIVWVKPKFTFGRWEYHWQHEPAMYGWRSGHHPEFHGERDQSTVWQIDYDGGRGTRNPAWAEGEGLKLHPTQKPVELWSIPVVNHTRPGQVILDPFAGSGPALTAAHLTGRRARLVERDPAFCDVICGRWQVLTGERPVLARTGKARSFVP